MLYYFYGMDNHHALNLPQAVADTLNLPDDLPAVLEQINKDFALQGVQIIAPTTDYLAFLEEIRSLVADMVTNDVTGLAALLYRIDIPERVVNDALLNSEQDSDVLLIKLIAKREYEKVLSRRKWSK
jgi:hypothetical protein